MTAFLFGALFLICAFPVGTTNDIDLRLRLRCSGMTTTRCAAAYVYEEDTISANDFIAAQNKCIPAGQPSHTIEFGKIAMPGDFSPNYEVVPLISHNCSKSGEWFCSKPASPFLVSVFGPQLVQLNINLSDEKNDKSTCIHPPVPRK